MSIINKMLNDLDEKAPENEVKPEVAFLEPKEEVKPQRSKIWWLRVASGALTVIVALIAAYIYYPHLQGVSNTLDIVKPQNPAPSVANKPANSQQNSQVETSSLAKHEQSKAQQETQQQDAAGNNSQTQQSTDAPANQPKLVRLNNVDENGQLIERKSTLSVQAQPNSNTASTNSSQQQNQAAAEQRATVAANNSKSQEQEIPKPVIEQNPAAAIAQTDSQNREHSDDGQLTISKVQLSNEQRAQKHVVQAQKLAQQGLIQPAIDKYQQAVNVYPLHKQARLALAGLYYGRNMVAEALEILSQGLNIEPGNRAWSLLAAKIHYSRENYAAALAYLQLPVHPVEDVEYIVLKATTLQKLKDFPAAATVFSQLTVAYPESARWWLGLATSLEGQNKLPEAIEAYRQTLRLGSISQSSRRFVLKRLAQLER